MVTNRSDSQRGTQIKATQISREEESVRNRSYNFCLQKQLRYLGVFYTGKPFWCEVCLTQCTKSCNGLLLLRLRQHDCVASTQRCDIDVLSFAVPSEVHAKGVFSKPRCSCHLPLQVLRCVIHIYVDDVRPTIKSLDVEFHWCFVCFLLWEWCKTQPLMVHLSVN